LSYVSVKRGAGGEKHTSIGPNWSAGAEFQRPGNGPSRKNQDAASASASRRQYHRTTSPTASRNSSVRITRP